MANTKVLRKQDTRTIPAQDDTLIMKKVRFILDRGNNAEIKKSGDGSLTIMEVKKKII